MGGNPVTLRPIPEQQEEGKEVARFLIEEKSNCYKIPKVFEETVVVLGPEHFWQVWCPCHGILLLGLSETSKISNRFIFLDILTEIEIKSHPMVVKKVLTNPCFCATM